jgi:hypothetical protein
MITNGNVKYSRTVKPADYEGKTVEINISFVLPENTGDADGYKAIDSYLDSITARVHARLGLAGPAYAAALASGGAAAVPATNAKPGRTTKPPKITQSDAEKVGEALKAGQAVQRAKATQDDLPPETRPQISTQPENRVGPDDLPPDTSAAPVTPSAAPVAPIDPDAALLADAPKVPTEKDVTEATTTAAKRVGPEKVHALRRQFEVAPPKSVRDIAPEKRAEWIKACQGLL